MFHKGFSIDHGYSHVSASDLYSSNAPLTRDEEVAVSNIDYAGTGPAGHISKLTNGQYIADKRDK